MESHYEKYHQISQNLDIYVRSDEDDIYRHKLDRQFSNVEFDRTIYRVADLLFTSSLSIIFQ